MGAVIEVKYFNSFVLKKIGVTGNNVIWDGSQGVPSNVAGGYPVIPQTPADFNINDWAIEEARIRGGYNNTSTDYGAKAYLVEEEPNAVTRFNTLIYSGIFNSRTGINNTNVFSTADDITKSADPANGSIQKLYAEDTNLVIFQERKVSRALIDKDAIYAAEGGGSVTSSNLTIGVIQPYAGKYGISKNPESFAIYGYHKYFADKENNAILRLSRSGIDEISAIGMKDFFRDNLNSLNTNAGTGSVIGAYDIYSNQYVTSLQQYTAPLTIPTTFNTLSFDESTRGWTSRYSYAPQVMFSLGANFYSVQEGPQGALELWKHNDTRSNRANFYGVDGGANVTFILNPEPVRSKTFKTIGYEGSNGWKLLSLQSDDTGKDLNPSNASFELYFDQTSGILSYYDGEYAFNSANVAIPRSNYGLATTNDPPGFGNVNPPVPRYYAGFNRKENKYVSNLVNFSAPAPGEIIFGQNISGIKGYFVTGTLATDTTTNPGGEKQLFSIESAYIMNNGY